MRSLVAMALVLFACSGSGRNASPRPTRPTPPQGMEHQMAKDDGATTSVVDGKQISFSELQALLEELTVEPTPAYTANLEDATGGFVGTEEHYVARKNANGDVYDYMIVRSPTHHHYELTLKKAGAGTPVGPAASEPARIVEWTLDGRKVDERTFEQTLQTLEVDAQPWVNGHLTDVEGRSGTSATFEARHRKTGELWTYQVSSVGRQTSRSLARGSTKSSTPRRQ